MIDEYDHDTCPWLIDIDFDRLRSSPPPSSLTVAAQGPMTYLSPARKQIMAGGFDL